MKICSKENILKAKEIIFSLSFMENEIPRVIKNIEVGFKVLEKEYKKENNIMINWNLKSRFCEWTTWQFDEQTSTTDSEKIEKAINLLPDFKIKFYYDESDERLYEFEGNFYEKFGQFINKET